MGSIKDVLEKVDASDLKEAYIKLFFDADDVSKKRLQETVSLQG